MKERVVAIVAVVATSLAVFQACASADTDLVAIRVSYSDRPDQVVPVKGGYGFLIVWRNEVEEPLFCVFDNVRYRKSVTRSWSEFLKAAREIPEGAEVERFNQCCASWDYCMPDENREMLATLAREMRWYWRPDPVEGRAYTLVCTCECQRIEFAP